MKSRRSLRNKPAARIKLKLTTRYIVAGIALMVVVFVGAFFYLNLGNSRDARASHTRVLTITRSSGDWTSTSTWLRNGVAGIPQTGDSVVIQDGHSLVMSTNVDLYDVWIKVYGSLWINNGVKLWTNRPSVIEVFNPNGIIDGGNGGTKIMVDNKDIWNGNMPPIRGYSAINYDGGLQTFAPLPVDLVYFKAQLQTNKVALEWSTASEINNDYFSIERSADGKTYQVIATVPGAGNSSEAKKYTYSDSSPLRGVAYYRLKQTDFGGTFKYSKIASVSNGNASSNSEQGILSIVSVGPNPFAHSFFVDFDLTSPGPVTVQLVTMQGKVVETKTIDGIVGTNRYDFEDNLGLPAGTYLCSMKQNTASAKVVRLVKN